VVGDNAGSRTVSGQSVAPAVVTGHSAPALAYCLTTPAAAAAAACASPYECLVPATFNVPWTIAVINPVILVTNISEQVSDLELFANNAGDGLAWLVTPLVASTKLINDGPVSTWMGDRLQACKPSWYVTSHPGQLSLAILSWVGAMSISKG